MTEPQPLGPPEPPPDAVPEAPEPAAAGEPPVPAAAPAPGSPPEQENPVEPDHDQGDDQGQGDASARAAELEAELAQIRADQIRGATVTMRVKGPHAAFTRAGVTVTTDPTPVPARLAADISEAAAAAGVELESVEG